MLLGTDQNGARSDNPLKVRVTSPTGRRGIGGAYVSRVTCRERGKPVRLPGNMQASGPQGTLLIVRVWEDGKSECRAVMVRIGVERSPHAKAGRLPSGLPSQDG